MLPTSTFWVAAGDKMITQELTPAIRYLLALSRIVAFLYSDGSTAPRKVSHAFHRMPLISAWMSFVVAIGVGSSPLFSRARAPNSN